MQNLKDKYTKAESLYFLKKNEKKLLIKVPNFIYFTKKAYIKNSKKIFSKKEKNNYKIFFATRG